MIQHLNRKTCCGHTFTAQDIQSRIMTQKQAFGKVIPHLYGGNAKYFAETACPSCGQKYLLWLKLGRSYEVLTLSEIASHNPKSNAYMGVSADGDKSNADEPDFDAMDAHELRNWLKARGISFYYGHSAEKLREIAKAVMTESA